MLVMEPKGWDVSLEIASTKHANPMALFSVHSGNLNETQLSQGFHSMVDWSWAWRAKFQSPKTFLMRFPNKSKLIELKKFKKCTLLGIGADIAVDFWNPDEKAKGKLHSVWINMSGVPDSLKHFLGAREIGSALGPIVEVGVEKFMLKKMSGSRLASGTYTESLLDITTKELLLYDIGFSLESFAE